MEIIVMGMHRSGTSLVAGIAEKLGVDMGEKGLKTNLGNPFGYFEDQDFYQLNERILESAGGNWHDPPEEDEILFMAGHSSEMGIKELCDRESPWGWKDPRNSLTMDIYLPYLKDPRFIVTDRDDEAIEKSFKKRDGHNKYGNKKLAKIYRERIESFFERHDYPRLNLTYDEITSNPKKSVKKIAKFIGMKPKKEAVEFIKTPEEIKKVRNEYRTKETDKYKDGAYHWEYYEYDPFYKQHVDYIVSRFKGKEGLILDVGCGDGLISALLARDMKVEGIDISETAINLAKGKCKTAHFEVKNVFDVAGGYDYLFASEVIEHLPDAEKFLEHIKTLFEKEALITTPNKIITEEKDPHHFREFDKEEFETLLKSYFDSVQMDKRGTHLYGWVK